MLAALDTKGIIVQTLELKIPPVIQVHVAASLMWTLAVAFPSPGFTLSGSPLVALVFALIGFIFALLGVMEFDQQAQLSTHECRLNPLALSFAVSIE